MQNYCDLSGKLCLIFSKVSYRDYPLLIQIAILVSILALCVITFTLSFIFYNRTKKQRYKRKADEAESLILDELNEHLLVYDSITDMPQDELNSTVRKLNELKNKNAIFKEVLVKLLIYYKHNLTGNISRLITSAYFSLRLNEITLSKLKSSFWFIKAQGLKELQAIHDYDSTESIQLLLKNKNIDVRVEAYATLLKLQTHLSLNFLKNEKEDLSNWHQILLFDAITKSEYTEIPDFSYFLASQNKTIVILSIKLLLHYKQFKAIPELIKLLAHRDEKIRNETIYTLGALNAEDAEQKLISIYPTERNLNKSQILLALGAIASGNALNFLRDKFLQADHYTILKSATAAIMSHPVALKEKILESLNDIDEEQRAIIKHFEDPLIKLHGIR
ncbi:HEAT repeat domain-containing protein [Pedobacter chinensis]|uniref:HEAT repeat domain-containing protein n=1 Tax=Pedobacter chinensis TaxID=2282421 RepID=A0A369PZ30_9SPHI|nr:HEAT repeat domain-containing protein [Pedobacter chinensis]RDC57883.1 HEAT repeat domain-containing protein [Pedobacter chinensis]